MLHEGGLVEHIPFLGEDGQKGIGVTDGLGFAKRIEQEHKRLVAKDLEAVHAKSAAANVRPHEVSPQVSRIVDPPGPIRVKLTGVPSGSFFPASAVRRSKVERLKEEVLGD
jgi:hypothetical protein